VACRPRWRGDIGKKGNTKQTAPEQAVLRRSTASDSSATGSAYSAGAISQGRRHPATLTHCESYRQPGMLLVSVPVTKVAHCPDPLVHARTLAHLARITSWPLCTR
jgi:hypothetical protein